MGGFPENEISEDLDLAFKAYTRGVKFKFEEKVVVRLKTPSSWREWLNRDGGEDTVLHSGLNTTTKSYYGRR